MCLEYIVGIRDEGLARAIVATRHSGQRNTGIMRWLKLSVVQEVLVGRHVDDFHPNGVQGAAAVGHEHQAAPSLACRPLLEQPKTSARPSTALVSTARDRRIRDIIEQFVKSASSPVSYAASCPVG